MRHQFVFKFPLLVKVREDRNGAPSQRVSSKILPNFRNYLSQAPKRPALATSSVNIKVYPKHKELTVTVNPEDPKLAPGCDTIVNVQVYSPLLLFNDSVLLVTHDY